MKDGLLVPLVGQLPGDENGEGPVQVFSIPGPQGQQALQDLGTLPPARLVFPAQGYSGDSSGTCRHNSFCGFYAGPFETKFYIEGCQDTFL